MKNVIYAKYNRTRCPKFQIGTLIFMNENGKYVEKKPLTDESKDHVRLLNEKYHLLSQIYNEVKVLKPEYVGDSAIFEYIDGISLDKKIVPFMRNKDELIKVVKHNLDTIFDYNDSCICEFEVSDELKRVFGDSLDNYKGKAIKGINIDSNFDNFVIKDNDIICLDYEWLFNFLIPVDYVKYRCLFFLFQKNKAYFEGIMTEEEFINNFGFDQEQQKMFFCTEEAFQQYVHGLEWKYIYTKNYRKASIKIFDSFMSFKQKDYDEVKSKLDNQLIDEIITNEHLFKKTISFLRNEITNKEIENLGYVKDIEKLNRICKNKEIEIEELKNYNYKLKHAIKNPIYALKLVVKKLTR